MYDVSPLLLECGKVLTNFLGMLTSPSYPENYANNLSCQWTIKTDPGTKIQLRFTDFEFEDHSDCRYDYLELFDGPSSDSNSLGKFCGKMVFDHEDLYVSTGNVMFIQMKTDRADNFRGFEATWIAVDQRFVMPKRSLRRRQNDGTFCTHLT